MRTFLINANGVESIAVYPNCFDALLAHAENAPSRSKISIRALPYCIGTKLTDLLTGDTFSITDITPTIVSYSGFTGYGKASRSQLASVFKIHGE